MFVFRWEVFQQYSMWISFMFLGPDSWRVVMLRNEAVRTKQNLSNAHEFVVCWFSNHLRISWALFSRYFRCPLPISELQWKPDKPARGPITHLEEPIRDRLTTLFTYCILQIYECTHQWLPPGSCRYLKPTNTSNVGQTLVMKSICNFFYSKQ